MRVLGNKIAAKEMAERVGIPTLPGYRGADQSSEVLVREAATLGYPLLIKAAAGGGGRGMRVVHSPADLLAAAESASREAIAAFGDGTIFLERYVERPRHVEVQVLADTFGTIVALGERECSVQRRHQKVVEEAPSPVVPPVLRAALSDASVRLAQAAGYVNAGTVEFLLDDAARFYFLEMNTRLQVEHPVTELVTGLDLVQAQIRIAAGQPLNATLRDRPLRGHAIEVRLYAEDPWRAFAPSPGVLSRCDLPHIPGLRIDTGVQTADRIGVQFDPLLAKLIAYGETRSAALAILRHGLACCAIAGVTTNRGYLQAILDHPRFVQADLTTRFLEEYAEELLAPIPPPPPLLWIAAALILLNPSPTTLSHWRHSSIGHLVRLCFPTQRGSVELMPLAESLWSARLGDFSAEVAARYTPNAIVLTVSSDVLRLPFVRSGNSLDILHDHLYHLSLEEPPSAYQAAQHTGSAANLVAPMPGVLVKIHVQEGQIVAARQPLMILEAMKMEHVIFAPAPGVVRRLSFALGAVVPAGAVLLELDDL